MRRMQTLLLLCSPFLLARCNCGDDLQGLPVPEIELRDPVSMRTNDDPVKTDDGNTPLVLDFGTSEVGTRAERTVDIHNIGTLELNISNISFAPADPTDTICPVPSSAISFRSAAEQRPEALAKETSRSITLTFTSTGGAHCRTLLVRSDDADEPTVKVYFTASATGPKLCVTPDTMGVLDFGTTKPLMPKDKMVRIESCGTRPVRVTTMEILDGATPAFTVVSPATPPAAELPPCDGTNAAACGFDINLRFNPPFGGLFQSTLNVTTTSAVGATVYPFQLLGKGAECSLQVVPQVVQFGAVAANQSAVQTVLLRNTGVCHCQVDAITDIAPTTAGFSFVNRPTLPLILTGTDGCDGDPTAPMGAASTFTLQVRYEPGNRTTATTDNGTFNVQSAANPQAPDIQVSLEATGGGTPRCELAVDPVLPPLATGMTIFNPLPEGQDTYKRYGLVRFGQTIKNTTKRMPISLTNRGNSNCTVSNMAWDSAATPMRNFAMEDGSGAAVNPGALNLTIAPGDTVTLKATYTPDDANEKWSGAKGVTAGSLIQVCGLDLGSIFPLPRQCAETGVTFTTNAQNIDTTSIGGGPGVLSFGFNASSVAPAIEVVPGEVDFGLITLGCGSEEREVKVYNVGNGDLVIANFSIAPNPMPYEFRITAAPQTPVTVTPGSSIRVKVRFYPRRVGLHTANLVMQQDFGMGNFSEFTVPLEGEGTNESNVTDVFRQLTEPMVDVLWVVDDSGSMSEEQSALATNFPLFFSQTSINNVNYHVAITTTLFNETLCLPNQPCNTAEPEEMAGYYTACGGNDKWLTPTSSNPENQFSCNVQVADTGNVRPSRTQSGQEAGLAAAKVFLSEPRINDPMINGGFLREDAKLYIIIISDEQDYSPGPVQLYVDFFQNLKGFRNRNLVSLSAIAGGVPTACMTAEPGTRYKDAVDGNANGIYHDICANNFGSQLQSLAFDSFGLKTQFFLSRNADPAQLQVCVSDQDIEANPGAPCTPVAAAPEGAATGYFYEAASNSIVFNSGSVPTRGQYIRVTYEAACFPLQP